MKHYFFIDDSGSKEWETPYSAEFVTNPPARNDANLKFWRRNYFVLAGVHVAHTDIGDINSDINSIKRKYFGTHKVEIKSDWLRNPHQRKKNYLQKFSITEVDLLRFTDSWYEIISKYIGKLQIQAFVLDKRFFKHKREECTPLQRLTHILFERIALDPRVDNNYQIVFDQMQAEIKSRAHEHGQILMVSEKEVGFESFHEKYAHAEPVFKSSAHENFLQLADTVAYNVWRQFVAYGDEWNEREMFISLYPFFGKLLPNFFHKNGRIIGIGLVKDPKY